ncbi:2,3-dimethylmalate lyase [uncultured delta proteobacterium]|uniref:2-methylisocitrate lyase n=1 Tax=uncultured delta proteobacterium TaxID=34034 RepID=A0A212K2H0_9DELT|nr:2,3-dimethylmalate lyase [uncultured delta proteobacterium]
MKINGKAPGKALLEMLQQPEIIVAPGCYDVLSARMVEQAGFKCAFMTGYGASGSILGQPDYGLMTMNEMVTVCANMTSVLNIPLIGDVDTGYGNPLNVYRTIKEFERAGVAAVHIEDQVFPKRCGHMENKAVIPVEEHVEKIKACMDAREDMLIIARTDSRATHGINEAIDRVLAYHEAGADIVYIDAPTSVEELRMIGQKAKGYKFTNQTEHGKTPLLTTQELQDLGFDIVIFPVCTVFAAAKGMQKVLADLKANHTTRGALDMMTTFEEYTNIVGMPDLMAMEKKYKVDEFKATGKK